MATKYFPVGYGRIYDSSKNYTEQQLRDLATTPTGEYDEGIYKTVKSFETEKTTGQTTGITPSLNVVGQDSNPYQGSSGGKGSPSINIPKPNLNQDILAPLQPNLDQDLAKADLSGGQSMDVTQAIPNLQQMPNVDQDLTKISVRGLQESAVEQAGDAQNALIDIGTAVQEQVVQSGKVGQEAVVKLGADAQEQAVKSGTQISGGQSNATLEGYANQITKGTESQINQGTKYVEEKVMPVVVDAAKFLTENRPDVKILQGTVKSFESLTPSIEMMGSFDLAGGGSVQDTSDPNFGDSQLSADPTNLGDDQVFGDLEKATGKDSKLTEEERLRRIRRLLLNRYGRENTILTTGPGDTKSRRRYAL